MASPKPSQVTREPSPLTSPLERQRAAQDPSLETGLWTPHFQRLRAAPPYPTLHPPHPVPAARAPQARMGAQPSWAHRSRVHPAQSCAGVSRDLQLCTTELIVTGRCDCTLVKVTRTMDSQGRIQSSSFPGETSAEIP